MVEKSIKDRGTERLICATGAGRGGENTFRLFHRHARCRKPVQSLSVSSLTDETFRGAFRQLRPGSAFDHLQQSCLTPFPPSCLAPFPPACSNRV